ncbi:hypothetical protein PGT21_013116 [Puccinia graminis f. sp. tritici]|uniref:Uncharacterized protein n=1 Tax=Puccinia graminis f. sp. tritici TaxID=56615 RepID=A0A5B0R0F5_PUCGR|nr:hypothetical protein PGT21_013116 [Puccinia graminis f. sp. tritici]
MQQPLHQNMMKMFIFYIGISHLIEKLPIPQVLGSPMQTTMRHTSPLVPHDVTSPLVPHDVNGQAIIPKRLPGAESLELVRVDRGKLVFPGNLVDCDMAWYGPPKRVTKPYAPIKQAKSKPLSAAAPAFHPAPKTSSAGLLGPHPRNPETMEKLRIEGSQYYRSRGTPNVFAGANTRGYNQPRKNMVRYIQKNKMPAQEIVRKPVVKDPKAEKSSSSGELPSPLGDPVHSTGMMNTNRAIGILNREEPTKTNLPENSDPGMSLNSSIKGIASPFPAQSLQEEIKTVLKIPAINYSSSLQGEIKTQGKIPAIDSSSGTASASQHNNVKCDSTNQVDHTLQDPKTSEIIPTKKNTSDKLLQLPDNTSSTVTATPSTVKSSVGETVDPQQQKTWANVVIGTESKHRSNTEILLPGNPKEATDISSQKNLSGSEDLLSKGQTTNSMPLKVGPMSTELDDGWQAVHGKKSAKRKQFLTENLTKEEIVDPLLSRTSKELEKGNKQKADQTNQENESLNTGIQKESDQKLKSLGSLKEKLSSDEVKHTEMETPVIIKGSSLTESNKAQGKTKPRKNSVEETQLMRNLSMLDLLVPPQSGSKKGKKKPKEKKMVAMKAILPQDNSKLTREGLSFSRMNQEDDNMKEPLSKNQLLISSEQTPAENYVGEQIQKEKYENKPGSPEENSDRNNDGSNSPKINQEPSEPNDGWKSVHGKKSANVKQLPTKHFPINQIDEALPSNKSKETEEGHELNEQGDEQKGNQINPENQISNAGIEKKSSKKAKSSGGSQEKLSIDEGKQTELETPSIVKTSSLKGSKNSKDKKKGKKESAEEDQLMERFGMLDFLPATQIEAKKGKRKSKEKNKEGNKTSNSEDLSNMGKDSPKSSEEDNMVEQLMSSNQSLIGSDQTTAEKSVVQIFEEIFSHPKNAEFNREINEIWKAYQAPSTSANEPGQVVHFARFEKYKTLWKNNNLDINLMNHVSNLLKVDEKKNYIGIGKLDSNTFQMIVSTVNNDPHLMQKIHKFLEINLGQNEAFRRMVALSKKLVQINMPPLKDALEKWDPEHEGYLFENAKVAEFQHIFDIFGDYGILKGKDDFKNELEKKEDDRYYVENKKHELYLDIFGENEFVSRSPPTIHFHRKYYGLIENSNYRNIIKSENFLSSLESKGISMNRILTVIIILGLENDNWLGSIADVQVVHYLSKVLFKVLLSNKYNHLPWNETAERTWLIENYKEKYLLSFTKLISRLERIPEASLKNVDQAIYRKPGRSVIEKLKKSPTKEKINSVLKSLKYVKLQTDDEEILKVESFKPRILSHRLKFFEPESKKNKPY